MSSRAASITPRLLTRQQAATYCSVSLGTFTAICPVRPVALGVGQRHERFDVKQLDVWIDRMGGDGQQTVSKWADRLS